LSKTSTSQKRAAGVALAVLLPCALGALVISPNHGAAWWMGLVLGVALLLTLRLPAVGRRLAPYRDRLIFPGLVVGVVLARTARDFGPFAGALLMGLVFAWLLAVSVLMLETLSSS
jgi:hypothetical protein